MRGISGGPERLRITRAGNDLECRFGFARSGCSILYVWYLFEEINHAGDGGLYGEMLMNRSFEERVLPEGYTVENGELVPPQVINHMVGNLQ